jgi:hypothetical protein
MKQGKVCDAIGVLLIRAIERSMNSGAKAICEARTVAIGERSFIATFTMNAEGFPELSGVYEIDLAGGDTVRMGEADRKEFLALVNGAAV